MDWDALRATFGELYGGKPRVFSAPGRVNLIGEHTDYNDGFVLPMAIERRTFVLACPRSDRRVRVRSQSVGESLDFDLDHPGARRRGSWLDYVEGTAQALEQRGHQLAGADLLLDSDIPSGAGLSSSAALEMSVGLALATLAGHLGHAAHDGEAVQGGQAGVSPVELALAAQSAEHNYVGTMCGIMDQLIAALGHPDQALLIDCRSLATTPVPMMLAGAALLVCDTRVKHHLASSEYNKRRSECREGVALLKKALPDIKALRDVSLDAFREHEAELGEVVGQRCRHVVTENARTVAAANAFTQQDLHAAGRLMVESHHSLRDDYQVSAPELDRAVETAMNVPGVYGARMTGGGFGGCTINLVQTSAIEQLSEALTRELDRSFATRPGIFVTRASGGAKEHD